LGHYDDCYDYDDKQMRKRNKEVMQKVDNTYNKLLNAVSDLTLEKEDEEHIELKLIEFYALLKHYTPL